MDTRLLTLTADSADADALSTAVATLLADASQRPHLALDWLRTHYRSGRSQPTLMMLNNQICERVLNERTTVLASAATDLTSFLGVRDQDQPATEILPPNSQGHSYLRGHTHSELWLAILELLNSEQVLDMPAVIRLADKLLVDSFVYALALELQAQGINALASKWLRADDFYIPLTPYTADIENVLRKTLSHDNEERLSVTVTAQTEHEISRALRKLLMRKRPRRSAPISGRARFHTPA
jgi:hypothetical protein